MRIIVRTPNWLGDCIMSFWAVQSFLQENPDIEIDYIARKSVAGIHEILPFASNVIELGAGKGLKGFLENRRMLSRIDGSQYSYGVLLPNSLSAAIEMKVVSPDKIIGYARDMRSSLLNIKLEVPSWEKSSHIFFYYRNLLSAIIGEKWCKNELKMPDINSFPLSFGSNDRKNLEKLFEKSRIAPSYMVLGAGAAYGPAKQWSVESYANTAKLCSSHFDCDVVLLGSRADRDFCSKIQSCYPERIHNLCGETSLSQVALALTDSIGFFGNDSGLMHLAALTGVPTVGLFFSTDTVRTSPLGQHVSVISADIECRPCMNRTCKIGYPCREKISEVSVLEVFSNLIEQR